MSLSSCTLLVLFHLPFDDRSFVHDPFLSGMFDLLITIIWNDQELITNNTLITKILQESQYNRTHESKPYTLTLRKIDYGIDRGMMKNISRERTSHWNVPNGDRRKKK